MKLSISSGERGKAEEKARARGNSCTTYCRVTLTIYSKQRASSSAGILCSRQTQLPLVASEGNVYSSGGWWEAAVLTGCISWRRREATIICPKNSTSIFEYLDSLPCPVCLQVNPKKYFTPRLSTFSCIFILFYPSPCLCRCYSHFCVKKMSTRVCSVLYC